jgi:hypothetical protein
MQRGEPGVSVKSGATTGTKFGPRTICLDPDQPELPSTNLTCRSLLSTPSSLFYLSTRSPRNPTLTKRNPLRSSSSLSSRFNANASCASSSRTRQPVRPWLGRTLCRCDSSSAKARRSATWASWWDCRCARGMSWRQCGSGHSNGIGGRCLCW